VGRVFKTTKPDGSRTLKKKLNKQKDLSKTLLSEKKLPILTT